MAGSEKLGELLGGSDQLRGRRRVDILISTGHYRLEQIQLLATMTETLFIHMRSMRARTSGENDRVQRLITGYLNVIKALEDVIPIWPNACRVSTR